VTVAVDWPVGSVHCGAARLHLGRRDPSPGNAGDSYDVG